MSLIMSRSLSPSTMRVATGEELSSTMSASFCYWGSQMITGLIDTFSILWGEFARVLYVADERYMMRLLVRARVKDVQKVPQFIVYEDPDTIDDESWTFQREALQHIPQGGGRPDEDPVPENLNLELGLPFHFFGLSQPVNELNASENLVQEQNQGPWNP